MFLLSGIETSLLYMTTPIAYEHTPLGCRMIGSYRFCNCFSSQENTLIHLIKTMLNRGRSRNNVFSQFFFSQKAFHCSAATFVHALYRFECLFLFSCICSSLFLFIFFFFLLPYKNHLPRLFFASEDSRVFSL